LSMDAETSAGSASGPSSASIVASARTAAPCASGHRDATRARRRGGASASPSSADDDARAARVPTARDRRRARDEESGATRATRGETSGRAMRRAKRGPRVERRGEARRVASAAPRAMDHRGSAHPGGVSRLFPMKLLARLVDLGFRGGPDAARSAREDERPRRAPRGGKVQVPPVFSNLPEPSRGEISRRASRSPRALPRLRAFAPPLPLDAHGVRALR
jgi:hypothetical protein